MTYYVYVLQSIKDGRYYIGSTNQISRRNTEHNLGKTRSLINRRPLILVHTEIYASLKEALVRERYLKNLKGGNTFKTIIKNKNIVILNNMRE